MAPGQIDKLLTTSLTTQHLLSVVMVSMSQLGALSTSLNIATGSMNRTQPAMPKGTTPAYHGITDGLKARIVCSHYMIIAHAKVASGTTRSLKGRDESVSRIRGTTTNQTTLPQQPTSTLLHESMNLRSAGSEVVGEMEIILLC
jgi:hypothetical protein